MSPPVRGVDTPMREIAAAGLKGEHGEERYLALTSALRRGARTEALEILDRWRRPVAVSSIDRLPRARELTAWLQREVRLHVEADRFQYALTLVERYATLPVPLNAADAKALAKRIDDR